MKKLAKKVICVVGPTASGKTKMAVSLAKKFNGEIISADSCQIYRGLDIGSGKDLAEYGEVKYHLIDICRPEEKFTMFDWQKLAHIAIDDIISRGKLPIVCGGTGLYIQALTEGFYLKKIYDLDKIDRFFDREELEKMSIEKLQEIVEKYQKLNLIKSENYSNLDMKNPRRLIRFIEKVQSGEIAEKKKPDYDFLQIGIDLPRAKLHQKIDKRVDSQIQDGFLQEVKELLDSGVSPDWLRGAGFEYRIMTNFVTKEIQTDIKSTIQELKWKTNQYARRQITWFERFPEIVWVKNNREAERTIEKWYN